jgi:hypothetical protein
MAINRLDQDTYINNNLPQNSLRIIPNTGVYYPRLNLQFINQLNIAVHALEQFARQNQLNSVTKSQNTNTSSRQNTVSPNHSNTTRLATIEILGNENDWAGSPLDQVQTLLNSVIDTYSQFTHGRQLGKILVRNNPIPYNRGEGINAPFALFEKGSNGEYQITLKIEGGYRWSQMAYQFAHELGHLLANVRQPFNGTGQLWFEEALNESLNLFIMNEMAKRWITQPPYPAWDDYALEMGQYVWENRIEPERQLPKGITLPQWLSNNIDTLTTNPTAYNYDLVQLVSEQLLLPLLQSNPELIEAMQYLNPNTQDSATAISFSEYLTHWYDAAPEHLRPVINKIRLGLLG